MLDDQTPCTFPAPCSCVSCREAEHMARAHAAQTGGVWTGWGEPSPGPDPERYIIHRLIVEDKARTLVSEEDFLSLEAAQEAATNWVAEWKARGCQYRASGMIAIGYTLLRRAIPQQYVKLTTFERVRPARLPDYYQYLLAHGGRGNLADYRAEQARPAAPQKCGPDCFCVACLGGEF